MSTLQYTNTSSRNEDNLTHNFNRSSQHIDMSSSYTTNIQHHAEIEASSIIFSIPVLEAFHMQTPLTTLTKLYLRRRLSFFFFIILLSVLVCLMTQKQMSTKPIFILIYCYLSYLICENGLLLWRRQVVGWKATECKLEMLLILSKIIGAVSV